MTRPARRPVAERGPRSSVVLACAALMLGAAGTALALQGQASSGSRNATAAATRKASIRIKGNFTGLYPGAQQWLWIPLRNKSPRRLVVRAVSATVGDASAACTARNLSAGPRTHLRLRLRPRSRWWVLFPVSMAYDAPESCQGAVFPLTYHAKAKRRR